MCGEPVSIVQQQDIYAAGAPVINGLLWGECFTFGIKRRQFGNVLPQLR